jgi:co-chaperonin GroES (HSP10)
MRRMGNTLHNYLRIEVIEPARVTKGGIELPDRALDRPRWGRVVEVGSGVPDITGQILVPPFEVGDIIYFYRHAPVKCDLSSYENELGVTYFISEGDVLLRFPESSLEEIKVNPDNAVASHLRPVGNWCIIQLIDPPERRSAGGIILPDVAKERPQFARVIAPGMGLRTIAASFTAMIEDEILDRFKSVLPAEYHAEIDRVAENYRRRFKSFTPLTVKAGDTVIIYPGRELELDLSDLGIYTKYHMIQEGDILRIM